MMTEESMPRLPIREGLELPFVTDREYAQLMRQVVEPWLASLRTEEEITVRDGTLHAENYILPDSGKAVVMLHGYTESAEKLREMAWYFLKSGYSVFSYDQRGHGRSVRTLQDTSVTHVNRFRDYGEDLKTFMDTCVRRHLPDAELNLFAHSMGGAVGAHFLIDHPEYFKRAVLSSPMIAPSAGSIPLWIGGLMAGVMSAAGQRKKRAFIGHDFDAAQETFENSCTTSPERFQYYTDKRIASRHLQNCSPTYGWVSSSVQQAPQLLWFGHASAIRAKVLLCQAALDNVVLLPQQNQFIAKVPGGRLIRYETAKHEIYNSPDDVMRVYVKDVISFLED